MHAGVCGGTCKGACGGACRYAFRGVYAEVPVGPHVGVLELVLMRVTLDVE